MSYDAIRNALRAKDKKAFLYTIEFFPEEGKYHYDGHRNCQVRFSPQETKANNAKCPKCKKTLTVGVMNRVDQLADRPPGFVPSNAIPFKSLIPLDEIIAESKGVAKGAVSVERDYRGVVAKFGTEFEVLMRASEQDLRAGISGRIVDGIMKMRGGKVNIQAGYDGEYGIVSLFGDDENMQAGEKQLSLF
jgi:PHP family Zn ribbon phosphoesterase